MRAARPRGVMPLSPILLEAQSGHVLDDVVNDLTMVAVLVDPST